LEQLNRCAEILNKFLLDTAAEECVSIPVQQVEQLLGGTDIPVKAAMLGLVQMKRLDVGCERGVKVYKIKME
jgi:hypothetical protein